MFGLTLFVIGVVAVLLSARRTFEEATDVEITGEDDDGNQPNN